MTTHVLLIFSGLIGMASAQAQVILTRGNAPLDCESYVPESTVAECEQAAQKAHDVCNDPLITDKDNEGATHSVMDPKALKCDSVGGATGMNNSGKAVSKCYRDLANEAGKLKNACKEARDKIQKSCSERFLSMRGQLVPVDCQEQLNSQLKQLVDTDRSARKATDETLEKIENLSTNAEAAAASAESQVANTAVGDSGGAASASLANPGDPVKADYFEDPVRPTTYSAIAADGPANYGNNNASTASMSSPSVNTAAALPSNSGASASTGSGAATAVTNTSSVPSGGGTGGAANGSTGSSAAMAGLPVGSPVASAASAGGTSAGGGGGGPVSVSNIPNPADSTAKFEERSLTSTDSSTSPSTKVVVIERYIETGGKEKDSETSNRENINNPRGAFGGLASSINDINRPLISNDANLPNVAGSSRGRSFAESFWDFAANAENLLGTSRAHADSGSLSSPGETRSPEGAPGGAAEGAPNQVAMVALGASIPVDPNAPKTPATPVTVTLPSAPAASIAVAANASSRAPASIGEKDAMTPEVDHEAAPAEDVMSSIQSMGTSVGSSVKKLFKWARGEPTPGTMVSLAGLSERPSRELHGATADMFNKIQTRYKALEGTLIKDP